MIEIYPLAALRCLHEFFRMRIGILNLARKIARVSQFEKDQLLIGEIILDSFGSGSNDRLTQGQILKDPGWCVDFSKDVFLVRYDAEIAGIYCVDNSVQVLNTKIIDILLKLPLSHRLHHLFQKWRPITADNKLNV